MSLLKAEGLSLREFTDKINQHESIVKKWPFSDMTDDERYIQYYSPTRVLNAHYRDDAFVIGKVTVENERPGIEVQETRNYRLNFANNTARQKAAWEQMVGVKVGLVVEMGSKETDSARKIQIFNVVGIEQPLTTPRSLKGNWYTRRKGHHTSGYIQGVVEDNSDSHASVQIGNDMTKAVLLYKGASFQSPNGTVQEGLQRGNEIRTRVTRATSPTVFSPSEGIIYTLKA